MPPHKFFFRDCFGDVCDGELNLGMLDAPNKSGYYELCFIFRSGPASPTNKKLMVAIIIW